MQCVSQHKWVSWPMFVKHFEDKQHHKSAMYYYYYYYIFSWNILHFLRKQQSNQLLKQLIGTVPSTEDYGEKQSKTISTLPNFEESKKKGLWKQNSLFMISIYNAVHSAKDIIWNLNWFTVKYKLISKWELPLPVSTLCIYISAFKSMVFTYHSYENHINTHAEHTKKYSVEGRSRNIFQT